MSSVSAVVGYLVAFAAGISFVCQQAVNARLSAQLGSAWWAGFISYLGGTVIMLAIAMAVRDPWPSGAIVQSSPWLSWTGGLFGSIYVAVAILLIPRFGAALVIALIVAGQMVGALMFDQLALLGIPTHPLSMARVIGAVLLVTGAALVIRT
ncbi:MAG: DMT family transporter [Sinobacteraceae bacterium]|nr:DMT family transporter [Nevskiaceae bacterium]